ncbi:MAG TPA: hypothetical protein VF702_13445 [Allosphingosinicella sp.]|jgi:YD repeat-containing protein
MTHNLLRAGALSCALLTTASWIAPAAAESGPTPPPRQDTQSPTGVSFATGAFSHAERDLAIGGVDFPVGLTLERTYLSSLDQGFSAYSGTPTQGWSNNLNIRIGNSIVETPWQQPPPGMENYLYSVTIGSRSIGFIGGSTNPTGGFVGTYAPVNFGGHSLEFIGSDHSSGHFVFTDTDGSVLVFNSLNAPGRAAMAVASWTSPDGTRADFTYDGDGLRSVIGNRGYALFFEYGAVAGGRARIRACAVNMARTHVTATSTCPAGAQAVTYQYSPAGTIATGPILTGTTNAASQTTTYRYSSRGHLDCITLPGEASCQVTNSYGLCTPRIDPDSPPQGDPPGMRNHEQVLSQTVATGETMTYSFPAQRECPPENYAHPSPRFQTEVTMTQLGNAETGSPATHVAVNGEGLPTTVTDPLGRATQMTYTGPFDWTFMGGEPSTPETVTRPEGNRIVYGYDGRGNLESETLQAKPDANGVRQGADIVRRADFPDTCTSRPTCNRPQWVEDGRGNRTRFTYDPVHGGVLTETGPAVNGVEPQVRYTYEQRYAWILNASGGYSRAASPAWVRTSERRCRTSAATGNPAAPCAVANDESVTLYNYGPDNGPNNLLLRGTIVDPGGAALRSCYAHDANGNRTSETSPRAGLADCP